MAKLKISPPGNAAQVQDVDLCANDLNIGREIDNDLVLADQAVSRHHARIHHGPEGYWIEDLQSGNGTLVNGQRIEKVWLQAGDQIRLGGTEITFTDDAAQKTLRLPPPVPQAVPPPPPPLLPPPTPPPVPLPTPALPPLPVKKAPTKKSRKGCWLGCVGLLLLLLGGGGAAIYFDSFGIKDRLPFLGSAPAVVSVKPSDKDRCFGLEKQLHVTVPGGLLAKESDLRFKSLSRLPGKLPEKAQSLFAFDISLGDQSHFERPLILEFDYDPAKLPAGEKPEDHVVLAYWDEHAKNWIATPSVLDPTKHTIRTRTRHLSKWSAFYMGMGWRVVRSKRFAVVYDPNEAITFLDMKKSDRIRTAKDWAEDLGTNLDLALQRYEKIGFSAPTGDSEEDGRIWAFLGNATSYWSSATDEAQWSVFSGNLLFPKAYSTTRRAAHEAAHELFHKIQNLTFNVESMSMRRWWMEATADFAAAQIALQQQGLDTTMGMDIKPKYLEKPITYIIKNDDGKQPQSFHDYSTSHFVRYLVSQGADFKGMWDAVADPGWTEIGNVLDPLDRYLKKKFGDTRGLESFYKDFACFYVLDRSSPMPKLSKGICKEVADGYISLGSMQTENHCELALDAYYSAKVMAVQASAIPGLRTRRIQVKPTPDSGAGIQAYVYFLKGGKIAGPNQGFLGVLGNRETAAELAPDDILLVIAVNATTTDRTLDIQVKDLSILPGKPAPSPAPKAPKAEARTYLGISVFVKCKYDQEVFEGGKRVWTQEQWRTFNADYLPITGPGSVQCTKRDKFGEDIVTGSIEGGRVKELKWKAVRNALYANNNKESWEIRIRDLPPFAAYGSDAIKADGTGVYGWRLMEPHFPKSLGQAGPTRVVSITHEVTLPSGKTVRLVEAYWNTYESLYASMPQIPTVTVGVHSSK